MEQRTEEWFAARCGKVTASRVADIIAKTKTGPSASRENYLAQLVCERLTGKPAESYSNSAMQWGTDTEPFARAAYEARMDILVTEVGFVDHPWITMSGASPDGLGFVDHPWITMSGASPDGLASEGMVEIKCPNTATHLQTLLDRKVPEKYITQMMWQMACADRPWCDFVSFDPRLPEKHQLFIKRINYDPEMVNLLENSVIQFLGDVDLKIQQLESLP
jgi:putative phage-type endonuclease